jgi:hypothetical protein
MISNYTTPTSTETKNWELKITAYLKKEQNIADNVRKPYYLIRGKGIIFMKLKVEKVTTFISITDTQDALELLK